MSEQPPLFTKDDFVIPPPVFDSSRATVARNEGIRRVDLHAEADWKEVAYAAVEAAARTYPDGFIVDDVWPLIDPDVTAPHELRAMGAVMRRAQLAGVIVPTDEYRLSARVSAHRNPRRIWRAA